MARLIAHDCRFDSQIATAIEESLNTGVPIPTPQPPLIPEVRPDINGISMNSDEIREWESVPGNNLANHAERIRETVEVDVEQREPVEYQQNIDLRWLHLKPQSDRINIVLDPNCIQVPPLIIRENLRDPCPPDLEHSGMKFI